MKDDKGGSKEKREVKMVGLRRKMKSEKCVSKVERGKGITTAKMYVRMEL